MATSSPPTRRRLGTGRLSPFHRAKLVFLIAAFLSVVFSVWLWFFVDGELGLFVGLWVPAIHSLGTLVLTGENE